MYQLETRAFVNEEFVFGDNSRIIFLIFSIKIHFGGGGVEGVF